MSEFLGPLLAENYLAEIANAGPEAQAAAQANLGISLIENATSHYQDFNVGTDFTAGTTQTLTLDFTPINTTTLQIFFDGVNQAKNTWTLSGNVVTFMAPIPIGVEVVEVQGIFSSATGTMSTQSAGAVDINGGSIDGTVIGGTTPAAGTFSPLNGTVTATYNPIPRSLKDWLNTTTTSVRAPSQTDDVSHGYQSPAMWNAPDGVYYQERSTASNAVWSRVPICEDILPGDVVIQSGAAPYMAFGTRRVIGSWGTQPVIDVRRTTDQFTGSISGNVLTITNVVSGTLAPGQAISGGTTAVNTYITTYGNGTGGNGTYVINNNQTVLSTGMTTALPIGTLADGRLDVTTLMKYLNANPGRIVKQYDQTGNGRHKQQVLTGSQPAIDFRCRIGNSLAVVYDTQIDGNGSQSGQYTYNTAMSLAFPLGLSFNSQNMGMVFAGRARSAMKPSCFWTLNNSSGTPVNALSLANQYPPGNGIEQGLNCYYETQALSFNSHQLPTQSEFVGGISASTGGIYVFAGDVGLSTSNNPLMTLGGYGGLTGGVSNGESGYSEMSDEIWWPNYLTFTDIQNVTAAIYRGLQIMPQTRGYLVCDGDSITEGSGATLNRNLVRILEPLLSQRAKILNTGFAGDTIAGRANYYPYLMGTITPVNPPFQIVHISAGTNDIAGGSSLATVQAAIQQYCTEAHAGGFKVVVVTQLPREDVSGANETTRQSYNAWLRANYATFADGLADWANDPDMGASSYPTNTTLCADGIHPTSVGYEYLAMISAAAINKLLPPAPINAAYPGQ